MAFIKFLAKRLVFLVLLLFGVATIVFFLSNLVPADPVVAHLSQRNLNNPEIVAAFKQKWGLDQPLHIQYYVYIKNLLQGDMGISIRTSQPVFDDIMRYLPATFELGILAILIASVFGVLFGVISAAKRNSFIDQLLRGVSVTGVSIPYSGSPWFLYIFFILNWTGCQVPDAFHRHSAPQAMQRVFLRLMQPCKGKWDVFWDAFRHLILPAIVLAAFSMGLITRTCRSSLLEVLSADYIKTARAKGLPGMYILMKHALGNALIPVLTVIGLGMGNLLGGMVLAETIFAWPGIGQYAYQSVTTLDFPSITGVALLIAVNYVVINLVVDILYGVVDPRVRYK